MSKLAPTNSFNRSSKKPGMTEIKKEKSFREIKNNNITYFLKMGKGKNSSKEKEDKPIKLECNPCTNIPIPRPKLNFGNIENKVNRTNKLNKETKKNEDIISLKNQNGDNLNPPRKIKPRRNVSVQQRKRTNKNFNFNSFLPKAVHQSSNPGIIGLMNEGENSDFINAVIQCFSNIGRFRIELIHLESNKLFNKKISSSFVSSFFSSLFISRIVFLTASSSLFFSIE